MRPLRLLAEQVTLVRRDANVDSDALAFRVPCTSLSVFSILTMDGVAAVLPRLSIFASRASQNRHKKLNLMLRLTVRAGRVPRHPLGMAGARSKGMDNSTF